MYFSRWLDVKNTSWMDGVMSGAVQAHVQSLVLTVQFAFTVLLESQTSGCLSQLQISFSWFSETLAIYSIYYPKRRQPPHSVSWMFLLLLSLCLLDMSVSLEPCTWDWRALQRIVTNTWSLCTTTTERSRVRTETEVSRGRGWTAPLWRTFHGASDLFNISWNNSSIASWSCFQSLSWCTLTSLSTSFFTQRGCVTSSCPGFRYVYVTFTHSACFVGPHH